MNVGDRIRDYEVLKRLGSGGMGSVYLVRDLNLCEEGHDDVLYALKLNRLPTPEEFAADESLIEAHGSDYEAFRVQAIRRFRTEARILHSCNHKGLPKFYAFFPNETGDRYYLLMDYVPGEPLARILGQWRSREGQRGIHPQVVTFWIESLADIMEYLHNLSGIIYRDLKPENIMITPEDQLFLVDFGISQILKPTRRFALGPQPAGSPAEALDGYGTPEYMAPEQYPRSFVEAGPPEFRHLGPPDVRTDVFALGALSYQLLTGSPPLYAFQRMVEDRLTPPRTLNPDVPSKGEEVVLRALRLLPEERYGSVREFAQELRTGLQKARVSLQPMAQVRRAPADQRKRAASAAPRRSGSRDDGPPAPVLVANVPPETHLGMARLRLLEQLGKPGQLHRLDGLPGSGRTTLLRALARRLASREIASTVWVGGTLPHRLVDPGDMTTALKSGGAAAAAGLLRARLSQRRTFLLVDGLERMDATSRAVAEAVAALAPPPGGGWVMAGPQREALTLPPMELETAKAFLWDQSFRHVEEIWRASEGFPVAMRLLAAWRRLNADAPFLPGRLDQVIPSLVDSLKPKDLALLQAVAMADHAPVETLSPATGLPPDMVQEAALRLAGMGLLTLDGAFARPALPEVGSTVVAAMSDASLQEWIERLAQAARSPQVAIPALWRARLLERVGESDRGTWLEAVEEALACGCEATARELYVKVREVAPEPLQMRLEYAENLVTAGGLPMVEGLRRQAEACAAAGKTEEARKLAEDALSRLGEAPEGGARALVAALEGLLADVDPERKVEHLERAAHWAPAGREGARHRARMATWLSRQGRTHEAAERARAAMQHLLRDPDPWLEMTLLDLLGDWARAAELAGRWGDVKREAQFLGRLAEECEARGDQAAAVPFLERLVALPPDPDSMPAVMRALSTLGAAFVSSDLYERAQKVFEQGVEMARQAGDVEKAAHQLVELGRLAVFCNDSARGVSHFRKAMGMAPGARPYALVGLAEAALVDGKPLEARSFTEDARKVPCEDPWLQVATRRILAEVCLTQNERWPALEHARPALADAQRLGLQAEADRLAVLVQELEAGRGELEVERGGPRDLRGRTFPVGPGPVRLGRDGECEVVLDDRSVSRLHAVVEWQGGIPLLVPHSRGSTTLLNGRPVQGPVSLRSGDKVQVGDIRLVWRQLS